MCGISGILNYDRSHGVDLSTLRRMREVAIHRGPDDHGEYTSGPVGLAFNRLSIIDLSGGHQPMCNEDGDVWLIFNGEIYNFIELRDDLISRGHRFRTCSDTETIIHAWEEFGEDCVVKLRGMFAFAIWDARQQVLFCARDRLGIKPFYYYAGGKQFAFASEMKSLLELPDMPREVDPAALGEFLRRRYVIGPNTMLRRVRKLEPGHTIRVTADGHRVSRYWETPLGPEIQIDEGEALERVEVLLKECLRSHLVADVPLGAFLSGGLDSSCVVGLMSHLGVADIKTFSIGYDSAESELDYARIVAKHFHTDHHELRLTPVSFRDVLPKIVWHMDEPVGDTASAPLYFLSHFARQSVTVVLSGEGADEIFCGYPIYKRMLAFERYNSLPLAGLAGKVLSSLVGDTKLRKYGEMLGRPLEWRYGGVGGLFSARQVANLSRLRDQPLDGVAAAYSRCRGVDSLRRMSYVDLKTWLADDLLVKADRMTMAHSLELRVPFLDHHLVEFAATLPGHLKLRRGAAKYLLKTWAKPLLPRAIIDRAKAGFPIPTKTWFRGDLAGYAREVLSASNGAARQFFSTSGVSALLEAHEVEDRSDQIYSLLVFSSWYEQFIKRPSSVPQPSMV
jgi:asparagine synthase (glutamine-hydrolysing)